MEWQPIKTAPKDGTVILVVRAGKEEFPSYNVVFYEPRLAGFPWSFVHGGGEYHRDWPTHWMPLPNAPSQ